VAGGIGSDLRPGLAGHAPDVQAVRLDMPAVARPMRYRGGAGAFALPRTSPSGLRELMRRSETSAACGVGT
jgi:hypothetical protein